VADIDDVAVTHDLHPIALAAEVGVPDELESAGVENGRKIGHPAEPTGST